MCVLLLSSPFMPCCLCSQIRSILLPVCQLPVNRSFPLLRSCRLRTLHSYIGAEHTPGTKLKHHRSAVTAPSCARNAAAQPYSSKHSSFSRHAHRYCICACQKCMMQGSCSRQVMGASGAGSTALQILVAEYEPCSV
jgi:hypothetical protein